MSILEQSIDIDVPVQVAYNHWTQYESFHDFMPGIEEVRKVDDTHLHWRGEIGGQVTEWDAVITEQRPGERVAWEATGGVANAVVATFQRLSDGSSRVSVKIEQESEGDTREFKSSLERFKQLVERRGDHGTIYEHAGGIDALRRLTQVFYAKVKADPELQPLFQSTPPEHAEHLALWLAEVFGGPREYTATRGGYPTMAQLYADLEITEAQRVRWATLLYDSLDEAGLPGDEQFRRTFRDYIESGSRLAQQKVPPSGEVVSS